MIIEEYKRQADRIYNKETGVADYGILLAHARVDNDIDNEEFVILYLYIYRPQLHDKFLTI